MFSKEEKGDDEGLTTTRIAALSDGIFAISMTLLVLTMEIPPVKAGLSANLQTILVEQDHRLINYVLSFVLLAIFWIVLHEQFHNIKRTDRVHLWINIFILMFVALIPFSTSLVGDFHDQTISELFFGVNLFALGSLISIHWLYATHKYRLVKENLSQNQIMVGLRRSLVTPFIAILAMIVAVFNPANASNLYILIPVVLFLPIFRRKP